MNEKIYQQILAYEPYDEREKIDKEVILEYVRNNEDVLTRENKIAHFTVSGWLLNQDRNKLLMVYHNIYHSWAWVGGHADGEEDLLKVIQREIEEETGVKNAKPLKDSMFGLNLITVDNHVKRGKMVNSHLHIDVEYVFEIDEKEELRIKQDENSGVRWISLEEVNSYSTEEKMKPIYSRLIKKVKELL